MIIVTMSRDLNNRRPLELPVKPADKSQVSLAQKNNPQKLLEHTRKLTETYKTHTYDINRHS